MRRDWSGRENFFALVSVFFVCPWSTFCNSIQFNILRRSLFSFMSNLLTAKEMKMLLEMILFRKKRRGLVGMRKLWKVEKVELSSGH